jgi:hypothetical protein
MRIMTTAFVALASGLIAGTASLAQVVVPLEGKLSMNNGTGFRDVAGPVDGKAGSSVMAGARSSGQIVYNDGCRVPIVPGRVVTITAESPCNAAFGQAPAGRLAGLDQPVPLTPTPPPPPPPAPSPPTPPVSP